VDAVSFTGSTEVGRRFLTYAAESNLKEVVLECGGKSPQLVMADAPALDAIVPELLFAAFWNMGENCACGSRLLVHESRRDELLERLAQGMDELTVGDPADEATRVGPLIEERHGRTVLGYVASGLEEGAVLRHGGDRVLEESGGFFVAPALFDGVAPGMRIAREEIFGPVLSTLTFSTEAEALSIANGTAYGLAASIYTKDLDTATRVGRALRAGTVSVNCYSEGDVSTPFGGFGESGFGGRDKSVHALAQYTELKTLWIKQG
jgi:gamma-glutamyl-gamma-aminobutyraldehyde dehydrogenase